MKRLPSGLRAWHLRLGAADFSAVVKACVPLTPALRREVHEVPDGSEQVDAALADVRSHPRMRGVEVAQGAVSVARENGDGGVLVPFAVFAAEVMLERALPSTEEAQLVPASRASVCAQSGDIGGRDDGEVEILSEVMGYAVGAIEPGSAHRARLGLPFSVHQVIDDERAIGLGEEFAEPGGAHRRIASIEVARPLFKLIVLDSSALREMATQLSYTFALAHQLDFGKAKFLALGQILGRFVGQIGLPKRSVHGCVYHDFLHGFIFSPPKRRCKRGVSRPPDSITPILRRSGEEGRCEGSDSVRPTGVEPSANRGATSLDFYQCKRQSEAGICCCINLAPRVPMAAKSATFGGHYLRARPAVQRCWA
jgi:hypothetical protein